MKKILFILTFLPLFTLAQSCKPYAEISGRKGTAEITLKELTEAKKLEVKGDCGEFKVISFEVTFKRKGGPIVYTNTGASLKTNELTALKPGTKVFFDNIQAKGPDGKIKTLPGITLILKENK